MKKWNFKKMGLTCFLIFAAVLIFYVFVGIFISGPVYKQQADQQEIMDKMNASNGQCESIMRHSFKYVTYTCTSKDKYTIYDKNAKRIASREKSDAQFVAVEKIKNQYPEFKDKEVEVAYGYDGIAYMVENKSNLLIIDFDDLEVLFYSGGE